MAASDREARRRRILERGSDRLALITGQVQTLPPSSSSPPPGPQESYHSDTASCPPSIATDHDSSHKPTVTHDGEDKSSGSSLLQRELASKLRNINASDGESTVEPFLRKCETTTEEKRPSEIGSKVPHSGATPTVEDSSVSPAATQVNRGQIFTPNQIRSAISASERTRIYCSIVAAILIVLSHIGFPLLGSPTIKNTLFVKPLYLVLLTNVSIVIARLLSKKQTRSQRIPSPGGNGLAVLIGNALEKGLVLQSVTGAVFMDCSIYAVVLITGLAMAQKLGW